MKDSYLASCFTTLQVGDKSRRCSDSKILCSLCQLSGLCDVVVQYEDTHSFLEETYLIIRDMVFYILQLSDHFKSTLHGQIELGKLGTDKKQSFFLKWMDKVWSTTTSVTISPASAAIRN